MWPMLTKDSDMYQHWYGPLKWQMRNQHLKCENMQQTGCQKAWAVIWQSSHKFGNSFSSEWHWCEWKKWSMRDGGGAGRMGLGVYITVYSMHSDMIASHFDTTVQFVCMSLCVCYLNPPTKLWRWGKLVISSLSWYANAQGIHTDIHTHINPPHAHAHTQKRLSAQCLQI